MPPSYASVLRSAGFTVLNSANNHSHDFGRRGAVDTTAALGAADITQTGLPGQISVVSASGLRIAFVGFAPYADTNNMLDTAAARRLIAAAKRNVDLVVVYMHAGAEGSAATHVTGREEHYLSEDRGNPQAFAHAAIDAGADLVLASGPHVLRGLQYYRGHLIAYSLGDFPGTTTSPPPACWRFPASCESASTAMVTPPRRGSPRSCSTPVGAPRSTPAAARPRSSTSSPSPISAPAPP
jgi:poly-gamma-glutamate capsule biosynthesis protein CapA/YwtB (metallophosphatase superfamily)